MTPAENPVVTDRKRKSVLLAVNAMMLPIAVAIPANKVNPNATQMSRMGTCSFLGSCPRVKDTGRSSRHKNKANVPVRQ